MKKIKSSTPEEILNKFVESMCPFVTGMQPRHFKKLPMIESKKVEV